MEWIEPWQLIDINKQEIFNAELLKELHSSHILFKSKLNAIAKCNANDDVLYAFLDGTMRVAEVHLTWKSCAENVRFPVTTIYCSFDKWKNYVLLDNVLPLVDYADTICMMGYLLMGELQNTDYFHWAESLVEQGYSFKELDILLSYSLDDNVQVSEFLYLIQIVFKELGFELDQIDRNLSIFMVYLCDRINSNIDQLDSVVKIFKKLDQIYGMQFYYISNWNRLSIDLFNIYTFEEITYFKVLTLNNYQEFVVNFAMKFKEKLQNKL